MLLGHQEMLLNQVEKFCFLDANSFRDKLMFASLVILEETFLFATIIPSLVRPLERCAPYSEFNNKQTSKIRPEPTKH